MCSKHHRGLAETALKDTNSITTLSEWPDPWKRVNLTNKDDLGVYIQIKLSYAGNQQLELKGLSIEVVDTGRRAPMFTS